MEPKMEGVNKKENHDYLYDDLTKIDTQTLKDALASYRNFHEDNDKGAEALSRIEGELLSRKELIVDEDLFSKN